MRVVMDIGQQTVTGILHEDPHAVLLAGVTGREFPGQLHNRLGNPRYYDMVQQTIYIRPSL
jgi:hypothetical protein